MHPLAFPNNGSGFYRDGRLIKAGSRVCDRRTGRTGTLDEVLQDGIALVSWDDGTFGDPNWTALQPIDGEE